jgi:hypothetical protein
MFLSLLPKPKFTLFNSAAEYDAVIDAFQGRLVETAL